MNLKQARQAIRETPKGAYVTLEWTRPVKTRKAFNLVPLVKDVRMTGRIGVDYDHQGGVIAGRENGELPPINAGLAGSQEWAEFPFLIFNPKTQGYSLRLATIHGVSIETARTQFRIASQVVAYEDVEPLMLASEKRHEERDLECFQVKVPNIRRIHRTVADDSTVAETVQETDAMNIRFSEQEEYARLKDALAAEGIEIEDLLI